MKGAGRSRLSYTQSAARWRSNQDLSRRAPRGQNQPSQAQEPARLPRRTLLQRLESSDPWTPPEPRRPKSQHSEIRFERRGPESMVENCSALTPKLRTIALRRQRQGVNSTQMCICTAPCRLPQLLPNLVELI